MSKPRELWWGYVKNVVRTYPELEQELKELRRTKVTPNYNTNGGGSNGPNKTTENAALRELEPKKQKRYDAVEAALRKTRRFRDGSSRCRLIDLVYFRKSHTLQGAADSCHVSFGTAKIWNQNFLRLVASELDLL